VPSHFHKASATVRERHPFALRGPSITPRGPSDLRDYRGRRTGDGFQTCAMPAMLSVAEASAKEGP
jgi:hypothetical protein